jgi:tetratricopeptide (TPR) repeat protein
MRYIFRLTAILIYLSFIGMGCSSPDEEANKLLVEAQQLFSAAESAEDTSYSEASDLYSEALGKLERIVSKYPSSNLAIRIAQGEVIIEPYTLTTFKDEVVPLVKSKAAAESRPIYCALLFAQRIQKKGSKEQMMVRVATAFAKVGMYNEARGIADELTDPLARAQLLTNIAGTYAEAGISDEIPGIVESIESSSPGKIAEVYAKAGMYDEAIKIAEGLESFPSHKANIYSMIAGVYAEAGMYDEALMLAEDLGAFPSKKAKTHSMIAGAYAEAGMYDEALKLAEGLEPYPSQKARTHSMIAGAYADAGMYDEALELVGLKEKSADGGRIKIIGLTRIASAYTEAGMLDEALELTEKMGGYIYQKADALVNIAGAYAEAGMYDEAFRIIESMESRISEDGGLVKSFLEISNNYKVQALLKIAKAYADDGKVDFANDTFAQAIAVAKSIELLSGIQEDALNSIAGAYAEAGMYDEALGLVVSMDRYIDKAHSMTMIGLNYERAEQEMGSSAKIMLHNMIESLD